MEMDFAFIASQGDAGWQQMIERLKLSVPVDVTMTGTFDTQESPRCGCDECRMDDARMVDWAFGYQE